MRPRWRAPGCSHTLGCRVRKARIVRFLFQIAVAQHAPGGRAIGIDMDSGETLCAEAGVRDQAVGSWKAVTTAKAVKSTRGSAGYRPLFRPVSGAQHSNFV